MSDLAKTPSVSWHISAKHWSRRKLAGARRFYNATSTLFRLCEPHIRIKIIVLQCSNALNSLVSLVSTLSIVPFLAMVVTPERVMSNRWVKTLKDFTGIESQDTLIIVMGIGSVSMLCLSHALNIAIRIYQMKLRELLRLSIFEKMMDHYFLHDYEFHLQQHSMVLLQNMVGRAQGIIQHLLHSSIRLMEMSIFIILGIVVIFNTNPYMAAPIVLLVAAGTFINIQRKKSQIKNHQQRILEFTNRGSIQNLDALRNIESIRISGRWRYFKDRILHQRRQLMRQNVALQVIGLYFKPMMEIMLAITIVSSITITILFVGDSLRVLVSLAVFGLIAYRLLPRITALFPLYIKMREGMTHFDFMGEDLILAFQRNIPPHCRTQIPYHKSLKIEHLSYAYPKAGRNAVDELDLEIPYGKIIGICGDSGSGKTTMIKIILGLLHPQSGRILIDDTEIDSENLSSWQNLIGYVSQSNTLLTVNIAQNIALGIPEKQIDYERIDRVLKEVNLYDFVQSLPNGVHTMVGEHGENLSGGQKQRITIARAIYTDPKVLIFDEATSALDNRTEHKIIDTLYRLCEKKRTLIVVAHRLSSIKNADFLVFMKDGKIIAQDTYLKLLENNSEFREMANISLLEEAQEEKILEASIKKSRKQDAEQELQKEIVDNDTNAQIDTHT